MSYEPDVWAKEWLESQRSKGKAGLAVEKRGGSHIVKHQKLVRGADGKRRKESKYLGVLTEEGVITEPRPRMDRLTVSTIKELGNAKLLAKASERIIPGLKKAFPYDHGEMIELAFARCSGMGELKNAGKWWKNTEDVLGLRPNTSAKSLSGTLERVGRSRGSQDMFFETMREDDEEVAVDMSVLFSQARGATLSKKGYNRFGTSSMQVNMVLTCGLTGGRPQYMAAIPGNAKETSARHMLDEFGLEEGTILVMDRGYCSSVFLKDVRKRGLEYIVAARRNSKAYRTADVGKEMFRWRDSAVRYGKAEFGDAWAYRFENLSQRNDELVDTLRAEERGVTRITDAEKAGNFMIISSLDAGPERIYGIYKMRCAIEERFDVAKNVLSADRMYMHDDAHIFGHLFITFVSLHIWMSVAGMIEKAGLSSSLSVKDVLHTYSVMKSVSANGLTVEQAVPKDVRDLDEKLGLYLFTEPKDVKKGRPKAGPSSQA